MDNPTTPNNSGISGFGVQPNTAQGNNANNTNPETSQAPSVQGFPEPKPVAPSTPIPDIPTPPVTPSVPPAPAMPSQQPINPPVATPMRINSGGAIPSQGLVGGVANIDDKPKAKFSFSSMKPHLHSDHHDNTAPASSGTIPPTGNMPIGGGSVLDAGEAAPKPHNNFALIAIIVGVVLLLAAGGAYYYLMVLNKPAEEAQMPVQEEQPIVTPDSVIDADPYINMVEQLEASVSADPKGIETQLKSLNFNTVDQELGGPTIQEQAAPMMEDSMPAPIAQ